MASLTSHERSLIIPASPSTDWVPQKRANCAQSRAVERVEAAAKHALSESSYPELRTRVTCEFDNGELTLRGNVPTFFLKQLAQETVRDLPGIESISNDLTVISSRPK